MKNSNMIGMDGGGSGIEPRHMEARATRLVGSSASCMNVRSRPNGLRSASAARRNAKTLSVLFVCVAAIFIVSSVASVPVSKVTAVGPADPSIEANPLPPVYVAGYTYDAFGAILPFCDVTITDLRTGLFNVTTSSDLGFYIWDVANQLRDPGDFLDGDIINVTATNGLSIGWSEAAVFTPATQIDVTLNGVIPEFPAVVLPVVGLLALVTVVGLRRKSDK